MSSSVGSSRAVIDAAGRRYAFADHHCFACGATNPIGMRLEIALGEGEASTRWTVGVDYVGWTDRAHGGIVATLLDEVMCWAPASDDAWAVTTAITVRFRSPAAPGERLEATARVVGQRRRIYDVAGEVRGPDGRLVAEGRGTYLGASGPDKRELKERYAMPPDGPAAGVASE
ncbi:MAG: PaaI family thioesterase [Candidatus Limnocylindria bacterium]